MGSLGVEEAWVKYGVVLISIALARKAYKQITHVDMSIEAVLASAHEEEGSICWQVVKGGRSTTWRARYGCMLWDRRRLLFRPHLMRLAYDQDSSHW